MRFGKLTFVTSACALLLAACASTPMGPTVQVLPSPNKPFPVFQQDQADCKQYAQSAVAGQADAANQKAVGTTLLGVGVGMLAGIAMGDSHGAGGVGAGMGAMVGAQAGGAGNMHAEGSIQVQYNNAYVQCMYSKGNQVPGTFH